VIHVTASSLLAKKCEDAGVDAIVAEGFEAGGHNGREETTTLCLIPAVCDAVSIPVIAAGGIASGRAMLAVMALGADGVQIGTRFVCSEESSAHPEYKKKVSSLHEGDTKVSMKKVVPVRLIKNEFYKQIQQAEDKGADASELMQILGRARAKKGMFEGDMVEGELEIGQIAAMVRDIKPAGDIVREIWNEFLETKAALIKL
jgi:enoyl-[acyl-carrier protein] reductase II